MIDNHEPPKVKLTIDLDRINADHRGFPLAMGSPPAQNSNPDNGALIEHMCSEYLPPKFLDDLFFEVCAKRPDQLQSITTTLETKSWAQVRLEEFLETLDGIHSPEKQSSSMSSDILLKIQNDLSSNSSLPNQAYYVDARGHPTGIKKDPLLYDKDNKHETLDTTVPEIFECEAVTQYGLRMTKMVVKIYLENIVLTYFERSPQIKILWQLLQQKVDEFKAAALKQRIAFWDRVNSAAAKEAEIRRLDELVYFIADVWAQIKAHRKMSGLNTPGDVNKRLIVRKFVNQDGKQDFTIDLEPCEPAQPGEDISEPKANGPFSNEEVKKIMVKVYLDERLVYESKAIEVSTLEKKIGAEINLILSIKPQILKFEVYEKGLLWKLVDATQMFVPYKKVLSNNLITDARKELRFRKLKSAKEIQRLRKLLGTYLLDEARSRKEPLAGYKPPEGQLSQSQAPQQRPLDKEPTIIDKGIRAKDDTDLIQRVRMSHLEEEYAGKIKVVIGFVPFYNEKKCHSLGLVKSMTGKCRKLDEEFQLAQPDVNDPRLLHTHIKSEDLAMKQIKRFDRVIRNYEADSIRANILRLNKELRQGIKVPLSHADFIADPSLLAAVQRQIESVQKLHEDELKEKSADRDHILVVLTDYLSPEILASQKTMNLRVRDIISKSQSLKQKAKIHLNDIVSEFTFNYDAISIVEIFSELFHQRRKFKPVIKKAKPVSISESKNFAIVINVFRGVNCPLRVFPVSPAMGQSLHAHQANTLYNNSFLPNTKYMASNKLNNTSLYKIIPKTGGDLQNNVFLKITTDFCQNVQAVESETASGSDPSWNFHIEQNITIDPHISSNYVALKEALGEIKISLFDDVCTMENKVLSRKMVLLLEKRYLGSLRFRTIDIIRNAGLSGTFRINNPITIFGYVHQSPFAKAPGLMNTSYQSPQQNLPSNFQGDYTNDFLAKHTIAKENHAESLNHSPFKNAHLADGSLRGSPGKRKKNPEDDADVYGDILNPFVHTSLDLRVTLDPPIKFDADFWLPNTHWGILDDIESGHKSLIEADHNYLERVKNFLKALKSKKVDDKCQVLFETSSGEIAIMNRLLDQEASPSILDPNFLPVDAQSFRKLAYFVSLIETDDFERDREDLILNNQEVLAARKARLLEKAVLLANYFIAVASLLKAEDQTRISVAVGLNQIGRPTACVLKQCKDTFELWDCESGESLSFKQVG